jgi:uncharacterized protein YcbK (DUF882 family)
MALNWSDYPNFSASEFACKCGCGRADMNPEFMAKLQELRNLVGPMRITSGFRCRNHPVEKRKQRGGAHSIGHAADIKFTSSTQLGEILSNAKDHGFKGCGVDKSFVHLDDNHPYLDRSIFKAWGY